MAMWVQMHWTITAELHCCQTNCRHRCFMVLVQCRLGTGRHRCLMVSAQCRLGTGRHRCFMVSVQCRLGAGRHSCLMVSVQCHLGTGNIPTQRRIPSSLGTRRIPSGCTAVHRHFPCSRRWPRCMQPSPNGSGADEGSAVWAAKFYTWRCLGVQL